ITIKVPHKFLEAQHGATVLRSNQQRLLVLEWNDGRCFGLRTVKLAQLLSDLFRRALSEWNDRNSIVAEIRIGNTDKFGNLVDFLRRRLDDDWGAAGRGRKRDLVRDELLQEADDFSRASFAKPNNARHTIADAAGGHRLLQRGHHIRRCNLIDAAHVSHFKAVSSQDIADDLQNLTFGNRLFGPERDRTADVIRSHIRHAERTAEHLLQKEVD